MVRLTGHRLTPRPRWACIAAVLVVLSAAVAVAASAMTRAPGLDRTYGDQGVVRMPEVFNGFEGFAAAADGDAFAFGPGRQGKEFVLRFNEVGRRDGSYGGGGAAVLPSEREYAAFADHAARVVIGARVRDRILLRRLTFEGRPDRSFGKDGVVSVPCGCDGAELSLSEIGDGRILVDADREVDRDGRYDVATKVWLTELLPDGSLDRRFGQAGSVAFEIPKQGPLGPATPAAGGAILLGGPVRSGKVRVYLWRVSARGRVDGAFARRAARSVRQLGGLGHHPELAAIVPGADGSVAALGSIDEKHGFYLRLRADGKPDRGLAGRGVKRLPFTVVTAVGGVGGTVFAVGRGHNGYRYRAFRILPGGALDPRYHRAKGRAVPLPGRGVHVFSQGSGRVLIGSKGLTYCRSGCGYHPAMTRFRE
jgi:hypothetical protein